MNKLHVMLWTTIIINTIVIGITIGMNTSIYLEHTTWEQEKTELNYTFEEPQEMMEGLDWNGYYSSTGYYCVKTKGREEEDILRTSGQISNIQRTEIHEYAHAMIHENKEMEEHFCD